MTANALAALTALMQQAGGSLSLHDYMSFCLHDPVWGYYRTNKAIGREADFITAPQISQIFGELIALYFIQHYERHGCPAKICLLELGPGQGLLLRDMIRTFTKVYPQLLQALTVHCVEINTTLQQQQQENVPITLHYHASIAEALGALKNQVTYVIANEFFDALPVRQYLYKQHAWYEVQVTLDDCYTLKETLASVPTSLRLTGYPPPQENDRLELSPGTAAGFTAILHHLSQFKGVGLFIDYGYTEPAYGNTLQGLFQHTFVDPFAHPGQYDLTTHVNFWQLSQLIAEMPGLNQALTTQAEFLKALGIELRTALLMRGKDARTADSIHAATGRLIAPDQMGHLFKVLQVWA
jgi:SAM-dependent MidA family methyltransferase